MDCASLASLVDQYSSNLLFFVHKALRKHTYRFFLNRIKTLCKSKAPLHDDDNAVLRQELGWAHKDLHSRMFTNFDTRSQLLCNVTVSLMGPSGAT